VSLYAGAKTLVPVERESPRPQGDILFGQWVPHEVTCKGQKLVATPEVFSYTQNPETITDPNKDGK
jgi:hypothetical protein